MSSLPVDAETSALTATTARRWFVPDAFIPLRSTAPEVSHESICVLHRGTEEATLTITAYFADREPEKSGPVTVPARRGLHLRTDVPEAVGGLRIERGVPYALEIESETDLQIQYSRLDTTQPAYSLMTALVSSTHALTDRG